MRFAFLNEKEMKSHYSPTAITFILFSCFLLAFMRYADPDFFHIWQVRQTWPKSVQGSWRKREETQK